MFFNGQCPALRPLKDAIFIQMVDKYQLPLAKTVSVFTLLPLVMFYTKLIGRYSREKMLIILPTFYGITIFLFSLLMFNVQGNIPSISVIFARSLGYFWYLFVESFGSLVVALFWAFATDSTTPASAKKGFPLVVAIGQMGGVLFPFAVGGLPYHLHCITDGLSMFILSLFVFAIIPLVRFLVKSTPKKLMTSYKEVVDKESEPGFLEGLKLLLKNRYLLGIFAANFIYEVVITIFDFNFKIAASSTFSGVALSHYLSVYGSSVNIVSLLCLLLGISNVTRFLGVGVALAAMPIIVGTALLGFLSLDSLTFLFALMVGSKAINYALNGPALKQLYIPTSSGVKFKAQAWIETFGSRSSKQVGSLFNMTLAPLQKGMGMVAGRSYYLILSGALCFPLLGLWLLIAIFLGRKFHQALKEETIVC
jgi:AAA family ATP:ADP antiporter